MEVKNKHLGIRLIKSLYEKFPNWGEVEVNILLYKWSLIFYLYYPALNRLSMMGYFLFFPSARMQKKMLQLCGILLNCTGKGLTKQINPRLFAFREKFKGREKSQAGC